MPQLHCPNQERGPRISTQVPAWTCHRLTVVPLGFLVSYCGLCICFCRNSSVSLYIEYGSLGRPVGLCSVMQPLAKSS